MVSVPVKTMNDCFLVLVMSIYPKIVSNFSSCWVSLLDHICFSYLVVHQTDLTTYVLTLVVLWSHSPSIPELTVWLKTSGPQLFDTRHPVWLGLGTKTFIWKHPCVSVSKWIRNRYLIKEYVTVLTHQRCLLCTGCFGFLWMIDMRMYFSNGWRRCPLTLGDFL